MKSSIGIAFLSVMMVSNCFAQQTDPSGSQTLEQQQPLDTSVTVDSRGVIQLQETIRASKEQPKVLTIVPWQPPADKATLPSPIIKRIEQNFAPISRAEFTRRLAHFEQLQDATKESY